MLNEPKHHPIEFYTVADLFVGGHDKSSITCLEIPYLCENVRVEFAKIITLLMFTL